MKKVLSLVVALMMLLSLCVVPAMAAGPDGSANNPYQVAKPNSVPTTITIPANSAVYYQYKANVFAGWEVGGMGLSAIIVDGVVYDTPDMWGEIYAPLNFNFMSPGVVAYVNNTAEDIEVYIEHNEPVGTENNPDELAVGENMFSIPANNPNYVADFLPLANGEYTFACAQTEDFIVSVDVDGTVYSFEDGSLTLELESYINVRFYISPVGNNSDVTINVIAPKSGTEQNPIWLSADEMDQAYALTGTEPMYFNVDGFLSGSKLLVESKNGTALSIELDGTAYTAETGTLYLDLDTTEWVMSLVISQADAADNELYFSVEYGEGTEQNPIELVDGDNAISIPENGFYYYTYTAANDGLLVITPADAAQFDLLDAGYEDAEYNYHYGYLAEGASSVLLPVPAGQAVIISACGVVDEDSFIIGAVDTTLNVVVKDLLLYNTFEGEDGMGDLEGWLSSSDLVLEEAGEEANVANGFYSAEFNVTKDWGNIYRFANVETNTNYEVTFKAKAAVAGGLWVKFHKEDWSGDIAQGDIALTTEWAEYTTIINSGDNTNLWLLLQYAGYAADGQIIWLDDIVITKAEGGATPDVPVEPAFGFVNGDFETGDASGWETWQSTEISADAAKDGAFGAHLVGNGGWGGLLNQTIAVEAGKQYKLSFWINVNASGVNVQFTDGAGNAVEGAGGWFDSNKKDHLVEWVFTATDDSVRINFCGSGSAPEDAYVDNFVLSEVQAASFDGYIYNGDFETGDMVNWTNLWDSCGVEFVEGYESANAISITAGGWSQVRQNGVKVEPNTDYVLTAWVKNANNFGLIVKNGDDSADISSYYIESATDWQQITLEFNSGDQSEICVLLIGWDGGGSAIIDNVSLALYEGGDDPVDPPVEPDNQGIVNGDFETGDNTGWETWQSTSISADAAKDGAFGAHLVGNGGWGGLLNQTIAVEAGKQYKLSFWINVNATGVNLQVKDGSGNAIEGAGGWFDANKKDHYVEYTFIAPDDSVLINFCGSGTAPEDAYVDNFVLAEVKASSFDGYIYNGDFETGTLASWENLWGSCPTAEIIEGGVNGGYALNVVSKQWCHVRQTAIAVEANTDYKITVWVKNANNMCLLVKDGADTTDIANVGVSAGDEWTELVVEFNSGEYTSIIFSLMGGEGENQYGIFDSIVMEKVESVEPEIIPGDLDGNGKLNNRDLGLMQLRLNDGDLTDKIFIEEAADLDGNGKVNNRDLGLLQIELNN